MSEVTKSLISSYKAARLNGEGTLGRKKASEPTVKRELSFLRSVFDKAIEEWEDDWGDYFGKHQQNPVKSVIKGLRDPQRIRYVLPDEARDLALALPEWLVPIVLVACQTGLRRRNLVMLEWGEVDLSIGYISIGSQKMKSGKPFIVKMTSTVAATLRQAMLRRPSGARFVFTGSRGQPHRAEQVSMAFKRACDKAGVANLRFHDLRHDFATLLVNNRVDLYRVQRLCGHSDQRMTQRYAHLEPDYLNDIDVIDGKGFVTNLSQSGKN